MEMGDYRNYIKIGEILRSPVEVDNQTQYILKCTQCIDMYIELESFVFPCLVHKETEAKNGLKLENEDEIRCDVESYDDCDTKAYIESAVTVKEDNGVDPLSLLESNISDVMVAAPNISQAPTYYQEESSIDEDGSGQFLDASNEEYEGMGTQTHKPKDIATPKFIQNFIKSEENIRTFMEAYKLHSHLLNSKEPHLGQTKKLHQKGVLQIKAEINKKLNLELTNKQISRLVLYMNRKFKNNLEPTHMTNDPETSKESESTKSEQYRLGPKHLLQVLPIYERFPFLWNSDLIEYCCKNQRREALAQMLIAVNQEMGLHEDAESLNLYILYIHNRFAKEKRRQLRKSKVEITDPQYKSMMFLYDHVGPFQCSVCGYEPKNPLTFKVHKSKHDADLLPLQCSLCSKGFKVLGTYVLHAKRHMDDLEEECKECGKKFINAFELKVHMRCHNGIKPFCCEICGISFRQIQTFTIHKRSHEKRYLHTCPTCPKGFYSKGKLDDHIRSHKQIREFVCKTCGKAFIMKKTLQQHQAVHEDVRKHLCSLCGKSFKLKVGLSQHMKTHGRNSTKLKSEEVK